MMKTKVIVLLVANFTLISTVYSQLEELSTRHFKPYTYSFQLSDSHEIPNKIRNKLKNDFNEAQFVGLAEAHQSQQLSYFTKGLLGLLSESCFKYFALELGPYSAEILNKISANPALIGSKLKELNNRYGKNDFPFVPLIFVDKEEDAEFIEEAAAMNYSFWGLDQEYRYSFEMHLDEIYSRIESPNNELKELYQECKSILQNSLFKNQIEDQTTSCWLLGHQTFNNFFSAISAEVNLRNYANALVASLNIYCKEEIGQGGANARAELMKTNFEKMYAKASKNKSQPKVFLKMGSVHLTHGISPLGINDIGKYLDSKALENGTGFISIYHLRRFIDGRDLIDLDEFEDARLVLNLAKKDKWVLIDLKPIRSKVESGKISVSNPVVAYGINSYDYILLSPNDTSGKLNF